MKTFNYQNQELYIEQVSLTEIAKTYQTPCYVYSKESLLNNWQAFASAFKSRPHRICYAVKANSNLAILNLLAKQGAGFDIVSSGELARVLAAGGDPNKIIFSGVGKRTDEIIAALDIGIYCFNIESTAELSRLNKIAEQKNIIAKIGLRINPDIDAKTHPYIATGLSENKFGLDWLEIDNIIQQQLPKLKNLKLIGIGCHIGSQLTTLEPFLAAAEKMLFLIEKLKKKNITISHLDLGGGLGVIYQQENPPSIQEYATAICEKLKSFAGEIIIEPGRALIANTGILLTTVEYLKHHNERNFAIVDAGMNDLLRPALYNAWHDISPIKIKNNLPEKKYDIVGPVCESADVFGKNRTLAIEQSDLLAIHSAGAYGFSMSSTYNSRPRAAEIMVDQDKHYLIRSRETIQSLFANEKILP